MSATTDRYSQEGQPQEPAAPGRDAGPDELEADIARTREQLGQTVEALTTKLDVKSQARDKAEELKQSALTQVGAAREQGSRVLAQARDASTDERGKIKPAIPIGAAVLGAVLVAGVLVRRRSRR